MTQDTVRFGNEFKTIVVEIVRVAKPVTQPKHREVQAGECICVNLVLIGMGRNPIIEKRNRTTQPFNRLKHVCRVDCCRGWRRRRRWRSVCAVVEIGYREGVARRAEYEFVDIQAILACAYLK